MQVLHLPWPPPILSPNARAHWAKKSDARKKYKSDCLRLALHPRAPFPAKAKIPVKITFCPPNKRRRDMDNMLASIKAALDAVAEAWGVDDYLFILTLDVGNIVKNGCVLVEAT